MAGPRGKADSPFTHWPNPADSTGEARRNPANVAQGPDDGLAFAIGAEPRPEGPQRAHRGRPSSPFHRVIDSARKGSLMKARGWGLAKGSHEGAASLLGSLAPRSDPLGPKMFYAFDGRKRHYFVRMGSGFTSPPKSCIIKGPAGWLGNQLSKFDSF